MVKNLERYEMASVGHLEDEAIKRREKLQALKRKREGKSVDNNDTCKDFSTILPKPAFRSYKPANEELKEFVLEPVAPGDVSAQVEVQLQSALSEMVIDHLDVTSLAPRKPDWDLKRDVSKKLAKLEKQTQRAIAKLIRERLKERSINEDLAAIVNAGVTQGSSKLK